jgi:crotonobetainyl-CoA:carnitine CoA-transferase CaiB-like acyl-CoA transferase
MSAAQEAQKAPPAARPLQGIRVVELAGLPAAAYAARLMADFGAEVIKVEPPGGDPLRRCEPFVEGTSAWFAYLNYGKKSVVAEGAEVDALIADADMLIVSDHGHDRTARVPRASSSVMSARDARGPIEPITVRVGWFAPGPYENFHGSDSVCRALAGATFLTGTPEGPPLAQPDYQAGIVGGLAAFIPAMAALLAGDAAPRTIEVSVHEACVALAEYQAVEMRAGIVPRRRWGLNRYSPTYPLGIYPCKEGWLGVTIVTPAQWKTYCELLGMPDLARHPDYVMGPDRLPKADAIETRILPVLKQKTAAEWFALGLEHRLPFAIVPDMAGVLASSVFRARNAIVSITVGGRKVEAPGNPFHLGLTPPIHGGAVPDTPLRPRERGEREGPTPQAWEGEVGVAAVVDAPTGNCDVAATPPHINSIETGTATHLTLPSLRDGPLPLPPLRGRRGVSSLPLVGMRIVDLSMGWAGPTVTRHLADLGADIVKVEACGYPDWWRGVDNRPAVVDQLLYEKTLRFNIMNRNKRAITLDLTTAEGANLLKALVKDADAVVENYSADVLPKLGLDYESLRRVNRSLVMMSMTAFGTGTEWRDSRAYGSTLEHGSGLPSLNGNDSDPPVKNHLAYGDPVGGMNGVCALLVALVHRRRTGKGQYIDLSQVQCLLLFAGVAALLTSASGVVPKRLGNRHPGLAPHNIFPAAGEDSWILVAATDDAMWTRLCQIIGREDLASEATLGSLQGRRAQENRIDQAITAWTRGRTADEAMMLLQRAGVAAGVVRPPGDLFDDPQLSHRGFWQFVERAHIGRHAQPSPPYRFDTKPLPVRWPAATLGQFNAEVLGELLGLGADELARLEATGVIGTSAVPPSQRKARAATA